MAKMVPTDISREVRVIFSWIRGISKSIITSPDIFKWILEKCSGIGAKPWERVKILKISLPIFKHFVNKNFFNENNENNFGISRLLFGMAKMSKIEWSLNENQSTTVSAEKSNLNLFV